MKMTQKEAVYQAIVSIKEVKAGTATDLSKDEKAEVSNVLVKGFESESIELSNKQEDLKKYVGGLINNWLRKDTRLNGGVQYVTKNPGSRSGSSDETIKNLRLLLKTELSDADRVTVEAAISNRLAEIKPKKEVSVDMSAIPADIKAKLGL